jgi:hypothetical protein
MHSIVAFLAIQWYSSIALAHVPFSSMWSLDVHFWIEDNPSFLCNLVFIRKKSHSCK